MSDPQIKYMNTYVDIAVNTAHDFLNTVLQLKTQAELSKEVILEKDKQLQSLADALAEARGDAADFTAVTEKSRNLEEENNTLKVRLSHVEALTNQLVEAKQLLVQKDNEIAGLKQQLEVNKKDKRSSVVTSKKSINKETALDALTPSNVEDVKVEEQTDDF